MNHDELDQTIAKLQADYAEQLPRSVAQMEALWRALAAGDAPAAGLDQLLRLAHGIAGAGGTFGFAEASRCARELEFALEGLRAGTADAAARQRAATLLQQLKQAVA